MVAELHAAGFTAVALPPEPKGCGPRPGGHVVNLPFTLTTRCAQVLDVSGAVDDAAERARVDGCDVFGAVLARRGHPVESAFAVTPLEAFLRLVARAYPEAVQRAPQS